MARRVRRRVLALAVIVLGIGLIDARLLGQSQGGTSTDIPDTEWKTYGADLRSTRYVPLDQINAENFNKLQIAWRLKTDSLGPRPEFNYQSTPLVVKGV